MYVCARCVCVCVCFSFAVCFIRCWIFISMIWSRYCTFIWCIALLFVLLLSRNEPTEMLLHDVRKIVKGNRIRSGALELKTNTLAQNYEQLYNYKLNIFCSHRIIGTHRPIAPIFPQRRWRMGNSVRIFKQLDTRASSAHTQTHAHTYCNLASVDYYSGILIICVKIGIWFMQ